MACNNTTGSATSPSCEGSRRTVVSEARGCDDGHSDHDQPAAAPHVLHEELLHHDVPQTLGQDQVHLLRQGPVALLKLLHLHLARRDTIPHLSLPVSQSSYNRALSVQQQQQIH